ncbi:hypothetical protein AAMO2058_000106700 [Amorphochlora amoebiformis]
MHPKDMDIFNSPSTMFESGVKVSKRIMKALYEDHTEQEELVYAYKVPDGVRSEAGLQLLRRYSKKPMSPVSSITQSADFEEDSKQHDDCTGDELEPREGVQQEMTIDDLDAIGDEGSDCVSCGSIEFAADDSNRSSITLGSYQERSPQSWEDPEWKEGDEEAYHSGDSEKEYNPTDEEYTPTFRQRRLCRVSDIKCTQSNYRDNSDSSDIIVIKKTPVKRLKNPYFRKMFGQVENQL